MSDMRILVIDDDKDLCEGLSYILEDEGYHVRYASDVVKGGELIGKHIFDIALFDYKMPGLTGIELLKKIKESNPETKVFIVSGKPYMKELLKEKKLCKLVERIIVKPFTEKALLEAIRETFSTDERHRQPEKSRHS